jgi:hypothetical protein
MCSPDDDVVTDNETITVSLVSYYNVQCSSRAAAISHTIFMLVALSSTLGGEVSADDCVATGRDPARRNAQRPYPSSMTRLGELGRATTRTIATARALHYCMDEPADTLFCSVL